ncbi:MAG TPA: DUF4149 domain-containing protein [Terriglobales bacterium]|nr:DUF4149 domain-containing protein [Terriglobales bacterium]
MQLTLRFLMLLALVLWLGGLMFFAFVVAPTVFHPGILPTRDLAGNVVNRSLGILHLMGLICGVVFVTASMIYSKLTAGSAQPFAPANVLIYIMLILTLIAQFGVAPKMAALRANIGVIDNVPPTDARRVEFNNLHHWSTRLGGGILILGLGVLLLTARRLS